jgi:hypothetical protein
MIIKISTSLVRTCDIVWWIVLSDCGYQNVNSQPPQGVEGIMTGRQHVLKNKRDEGH